MSVPFSLVGRRKPIETVTEKNPMVWAGQSFFQLLSLHQLWCDRSEVSMAMGQSPPEEE